MFGESESGKSNLHRPRAADTLSLFDKGELITWFEGRPRPKDVSPRLSCPCGVLEHTPTSVWEVRANSALAGLRPLVERAKGSVVSSQPEKPCHRP